MPRTLGLLLSQTDAFNQHWCPWSPPPPAFGWSPSPASR